MKVPKFMKNETPKKQFDCSSAVSNTKLINTFKTIYFTPDLQQQPQPQAKNEINSTWSANIYNLTPTVAVNTTKLKQLNVAAATTGNTNSATRYTKSSQPKRLKRNRLLINAKFSVNKNETPVKAYLNSKRQSMINENNKLSYNDPESTDPDTPLKSPISIKKSFISRSPLSVLTSSSAVNNNEVNITASNSKLKNFVKNSFTNLHKLMNKSKTRLTAAKNSNNCSPVTSPSSSSSSLSSDDSASPELKPQNLIYKYPQQQEQQPKPSRFNGCQNSSTKKRPVMGITALMLNNYNKQMAAATTTTTGFTTTWPNVYLLGIPIVFQNENNNESNNKKSKARNSSKARLSNTIDANNNNEEDNRNGFKLEIYGENVNESIRI